jgi:hypothetical protein
MPGVPRELAEHKLKVYPQARPIRQKLRRFTPDKREAIRAELARLVMAGFIREVLHPEWLANPVLVLKRIKWNGACASTIRISTNTVQRIPSGFLGYTRWWIQPPDVLCCLFWIATLGIIRLVWQKKTRKKQYSSPRSEPSAIPPCCSASKTLEQLIRELFRHA